MSEKEKSKKSLASSLVGSLPSSSVNEVQPLPTEGQQEVFPSLFEDLQAEAKGDKSTIEGRNLVDVLIEDLEERRQIGIQKYGRSLQTFNGRDALKDAYQEALDLMVYLKQRLLEAGPPPAPGSVDFEPEIGQLMLCYQLSVTTAATLRLLMSSARKEKVSP